MLNAGHNQLEGKVSVARCPALKALILNDNRVETVGGLEKLGDLNTLVLSANAVGGGACAWLTGATALEKLTLSRNAVTNAIGPTLRALKRWG